MTTIDGHALSAILQMANEPIILVTHNYLIQHINKSAEKLLSVKPNELINTLLSSMCTKEDLNKLVSTKLTSIQLIKNNTALYCCVLLVQQSEQAIIAKINQKNEIANLSFNEYLDTIISQIPASVYWMNNDYIYQGCSDSMARLLHLVSRQNIVGKTYNDLYDEKSSASYREADKAVIERGMSVSLEEPLYQPDGTKLTYLSKKVPLRNEHGNVIGMLGISTDITERKRIEEELKLSKEAAEAGDRAKTEFLANMRHDIRTPLSGIVGFAEILKNESQEPQIKEYADNLIASSFALLDLMDEVLEAVSVSSGDIPKLKRKFNVKSLVDKAIDLHKAKAAEKKILLNTFIDQKLPQFVIGDKIRIHRIMSELIGNALNFTEKGHVTLTVDLAKKENRGIVVRITVADSGIGIAKEMQQEIYLQFKRLTPSYKGLYKGTGLGLYVVKQFIDELNGEIYVKSKVGEGSSFTCLIPLQESLLDDDDGIDDEDFTFEEERYFNPILKKSLTPNKTQSQFKVLVVEDNAVAQKVAFSLLNSMNCHVDVASSGDEAITKIMKNHYDLIFMDIGLGQGADGYEVTKQIRNKEKDNEHTPIVALTAHAAEENKQHCIEAGMDAVLAKPITKAHASNILNAFVRNPEMAKHEKELKAKLDLPDNEEDLFSLEQFPLLETGQTLKDLGDKAILVELLEDLIQNDLKEDFLKMKIAYASEDYDQVEKIAHKMKGGAVYVGTIRMKYACQYLERYRKSGQLEHFPKLYEQVVTVIEATESHVKNWLKKESLDGS